MGFLRSIFGMGLGSLSAKYQANIEGEIDGIDVFINGNLYPTQYSNVPPSCRISIDTSIHDIDSDEPILSKINDLKMAPDIPIYYFNNPGPNSLISQDMGYDDWVPIAFIPDETHLESPYKGTRNVKILVECLTSDEIILSRTSTNKMMYFDESGYLDLDEERL